MDREDLPGVAPGTANGRARPLVLVAEDNLINQKVTTRMMEKRGFEVDVVDTGAKAVQAHGQKDYDLILMDCQMPELDGYEATREIRKRKSQNPAPRHIPIIAVTANALAGDDEKCFAAGMDEYLTKPVSPDKLDTMLERWTRKR